MRRRLLLVLGALLATAAVAGFSSSLRAQEKEDAPEPRVRAFAFGAGGSYLGVYIEEVDREAADRLGLSEPRGALLTDISEESPASEAGLEKDDIILSWNGARVESAMQLRRLVRETPADRTVRLGVWRDGDEREISVTLGERPGRRAWARAHERRMKEMRELGESMKERMRHVGPGGAYSIFINAERGRLGVVMQSLSEQLGEYFGASDGKGALISSVREDSPAEKAGLKAGDVITRIGDVEIEDPGDAARAVRDAEAGPITVTILRDKRERSLTVELPEREGSRLHFGPPSEQAFYFEFDGPEEFSFEVPEFDVAPLVIPEFTIPSFTIPEISTRSIVLPEFAIPEMVVPEIVVPEFEIRGIRIPEMVVPATPRAVRAPSVAPATPPAVGFEIL
ncbi:MAG: PDZ domain-containing protein [Gemmatimonadota bacterium]